MKNKKAYNMLEVVIAAAVLFVLLVWFFNALFPILTQKLTPSFKGQTEYVTEDCDGDKVTGPNDDCPCVYSEQKRDKGQSCGQTNPKTAADICPNLCKLT